MAAVDYNPPTNVRASYWAIVPALLTLAAASPIVTSPAEASNPPVVYVHGLTENACANGNLTAVLGAIVETLPQGGLVSQDGKACADEKATEAATTSNPIRFRYVADRSEGGDYDNAEGGSSQSGAEANARALSEYLRELTREGEKAMLVGYSMGGLIIRTYLARYPDAAKRRVAAVVFVESAVQGSLWGAAGRAVNAKAAGAACLKFIGFPGGTPLCAALLQTARDKLRISDTPDAIAFRDLSPRSSVVEANAQEAIPSGIRFLTAPGDIQITRPPNYIGEWRGNPSEPWPIGDGLIPLGDPDPSALPALGGASFQPTGGDAVMGPLTRTCGLESRELSALRNAYILANPFNLADKIRCIADAPEAHWNINGMADIIKPGAKTLPQRIVDFLVDTCRREKLGDCSAPRPQPERRLPSRDIVADYQLSVTGLGPIRIGMTLDQIRSTTGLNFTEKRFGSGPCTEFLPPTPLRGTTLTAIDERLRTIQVSQESSLKTSENIGLGDDGEVLGDTYGGRLSSVDAPGLGVALYRLDAAPGGTTIQFQVKDGRLNDLTVGRPEDFYYPNGTEICS